MWSMKFWIMFSGNFLFPCGVGVWRGECSYGLNYFIYRQIFLIGLIILRSSALYFFFLPSSPVVAGNFISQPVDSLSLVFSTRLPRLEPTWSICSENESLFSCLREWLSTWGGVKFWGSGCSIQPSCHVQSRASLPLSVSFGTSMS